MRLIYAFFVVLPIPLDFFARKKLTSTTGGEIVTDTCEDIDYCYFYDEDGEFIEERESEYESFLNID
ncbi:MAG TPA: hypothetical protein DIT57_03525 [Enterococcus sp.]|nr:hypothetical protein [Enterococcus sp.]